MRQPSGRRHNVFPSRVASNLMLSAYLLGMFLVVNKFATKIIARNYVYIDRSQKIYTDKMPTGDSGGLTSRAFTMLTWRV